MAWLLFAKSVAIGFAIAAPVGPVGVLCAQRSLRDGRLAGLLSGIGAATADAVYGLVAALGVNAVSAFIAAQTLWLRLIGGAILLGLGARTFIRPPATDAAKAEAATLMQDFVSTFVLTITNPVTILSFAAIFIAVGIDGVRPDPYAVAAVVLGVFCGSTLWWIILSVGLGLLHGRLDPAALRWVNRIAGAIVAAFGAAALASIAF